MTVAIKWFPPSWFQIKTRNKMIYIDPAYLKKHYTNYPKKIEFSNWPDPIDGLPEKDLEKADIILVTHHHKDHCKSVTVNRLKKQNTTVIAPKRDAPVKSLHCVILRSKATKNLNDIRFFAIAQNDNRGFSRLFTRLSNVASKN